MLVCRVLRVFKALLELRDHKVLKAHRVFRDTKVKQEHLVVLLLNSLMIVIQQTQNLVMVSLGLAMLT
jgi:hypothetical protein